MLQTDGRRLPAEVAGSLVDGVGVGQVVDEGGVGLAGHHPVVGGSFLQHSDFFLLGLLSCLRFMDFSNLRL